MSCQLQPGQQQKRLKTQRVKQQAARRMTVKKAENSTGPRLHEGLGEMSLLMHVIATASWFIPRCPYGHGTSMLADNFRQAPWQNMLKEVPAAHHKTHNCQLPAVHQHTGLLSATGFWDCRLVRDVDLLDNCRERSCPSKHRQHFPTSERHPQSV